MIVYSQTQPLTADGEAGGYITVRDSTNIAPGAVGILSDANTGPITVRVETVDYSTHRLRMSHNGVYESLSNYTRVNGARLFLSKQITATGYVPVVDPLAIESLAGFVNRTDSVIAFNPGTMLLSVTPAVSSFTVWINGLAYTFSSAQSILIPSSIGTHFVYFNSSGVLTTSVSPWDITSATTAPLATVYWDGTAGYVGDERHSASRDRVTHAYLHNTRGTAYDNGLGGTFADSTISVSSGVIWDEDIEHTITGPITSTSLWWPESTGMAFDTGVVAPRAVSGLGVLQYAPSGVGSVWGLVNAGLSEYVTNWVYATNNPSDPILTAVGQQVSTTLDDARNAPQPSFTNVSVREWKLLYAVIYQNVASNAVFVEAIDHRNTSNLPNAVVTALPAASVGVTTVANIGLTEGNAQSSFEKVYIDSLLVSSPTFPVSYAASYNADGTINYETWTTTATSRLARRVDYTYLTGKVATEITRAYSPADGTTVIGQTTATYTYTGSVLTSATIARNT